jgi:hypothetical protein
MKILAIDLGEFKSVACLFDTESNQAQYETLEVYNRIYAGQKTRKKTAIVAVARKLLVCCWAMLKHNHPWNRPGVQPTNA